ncbi:helix-turn-helix domain-containing protein [Hathewaya histolytica]|uniref:helix-turn-helix domain-containing protein n=1 Tax=Hathewaya histolytica TaxID=1498 RepID=UPI003B679D8D
MTTKQYEKLAKEISGLEGKYIGKGRVRLIDGSILDIGENLALQLIDQDGVFTTIAYQYQKGSWKSTSMSSYSKGNVDNTQGEILEDVLTFSEAAEKYGLSNGAVLRNYVKRGLLEENEYRKSGNVWLVKKSAMERLFKKD